MIGLIFYACLGVGQQATIDGIYIWGNSRGLASNIGYLAVQTDGKFCSTINPATNKDNIYLKVTDVANATECKAFCSEDIACAYYLYASTPDVAANATLKKCYLLPKAYSNENCKSSMIDPADTVNNKSKYKYYRKKIFVDDSQ